jgi:hypothetical protein
MGPASTIATATNSSSRVDAAMFLKGKGRRSFEIVDDFETDSDEPPEGTISIERHEEEPG